MSSVKNIKSLGSLFAATLFLVVTALTIIPASVWTSKASAACSGSNDLSNGSVVVTLDKDPGNNTKVTITRAEDIPADFACDHTVHAAETITLSGGCVSTGQKRCSNTNYSSSTLPYSGYKASNVDCHDNNSSYQSWNITVTNSSGAVVNVPAGFHIACGGEKRVSVKVVDPKTTGTLSGSAIYKPGESCIPVGSTYDLYPDGKGSADANTTTDFPVDKSGNYTISGIKPGTYDVVLSCAYGSDQGARQSYGFVKQHVKIEAGKTTKVDFAYIAASDGGNADNTPTPSCETSGFGLAWILCKVIDGLADAVNGIFTGIIQPMLVTPGIGDNSKAGSKLKQAWSTFRVMADVFLVIALLVVVFGESIGGGMIDAYTVKKVLPRILIGAVLINISYYLVAGAIDISNIVGRGIGELITAPFGLTNGANHFKFDLSAQSTADNSWNLISFGGAAGAAGIAGLFAVGTAMTAGLGATLMFLLFSILLPLLFIVIAIMATLAIRIGLIYALVLASPLAFAAFVLPNTEKYFKKWWELLQELLLIYPIITVLFALSQVVSQTNLWASGGDAGISGKVFGFFISLIILVIPLAAIPFAFKLAGGILGRLHELVHTAGQRSRSMINGNDKDPNSRRNRAMGNWKNANVQNRQERYQKLQDKASSATGLRRRALRARASMLGGYNIEAAASAVRAQVGKEVNDQIATGRDEEIRGLTVNKQHALSHGREGVDYRTQDGTRQFKSLGGQWINEADVDAGHARWGKNTFAQQAALSYEMRKALDEGQVQNVAKNYRNVAQGPGGWGMSDQQAGGAWIGAAFERQNEHLEYKSTDWTNGGLKRDANGTLGGGLVDEIYEKRGSYNVAQMGSNTVEQLKTSYADAQRRNDTGTMDKISAISETFMHQMGADPNDPASIAFAQGQQTPQPTAGPGGGREPIRTANTPGAAHVAERVYELAALTGVNKAAPTRRQS